VKSFQAIEPEYLDLRALSNYSCLSVRTLRGILSQPGGPPHYRPGGKVLIKKSDWNSWMAQYRQKPQDLDALVDKIMADLAEEKDK
jgi:hypothetical protein